MDVKIFTVEAPVYKPHRRPDAHRRRRHDRPLWEYLVEFILMTLFFLAFVALAEWIAAILGCPADGWPWL